MRPPSQDHDDCNTNLFDHTWKKDNGYVSLVYPSGIHLTWLILVYRRLAIHRLSYDTWNCTCWHIHVRQSENKIRKSLVWITWWEEQDHGDCNTGSVSLRGHSTAQSKMARQIPIVKNNRGISDWQNTTIWYSVGRILGIAWIDAMEYKQWAGPSTGEQERKKSGYSQ